MPQGLHARTVDWQIGSIVQATPRLLRRGACLLVFLGTLALLSEALPGSAAQSKLSAESTDSFVFTTRRFTPYSSVLLGNGYLIGTTPWNGSAATSSTLAGLYDRLEERTYAYQALIPSWNEVDYWNGSHWLNQVPIPDFHASAYQQSLDAYRGVLQTQYDWVDGDRVTRVEVESFTARQIPGLGVARFSFTPHYGVEAGPVTVSFPLGDRHPDTFVWEGMTLPGAIPIERAGSDPDQRGFWARSANGTLQRPWAKRCASSSLQHSTRLRCRSDFSRIYSGRR